MQKKTSGRSKDSLVYSSLCLSSSCELSAWLIFRITGFDDSWSKLEKWFNKFGILSKVNVDNCIGMCLYHNISPCRLSCHPTFPTFSYFSSTFLLFLFFIKNCLIFLLIPTFSHKILLFKDSLGNRYVFPLVIRSIGLVIFIPYLCPRW